MIPNYPPAPDEYDRAKRTESGTISLAFGCAAAFFAFVPFIGVIAWVLGGCGVAYGVGAFRKLRRGEPDARVSAIVGLSLSSFALLACVGWVAVTLASLLG